MPCASVGLPVPIHLPEDDAVEMFDPLDELLIFSELYTSATAEPLNVVYFVIREVQHHDTGSNVFCLTAHAGCGKTFTQTTIIRRIRSLNLSCIVTAFSGFASTLLIGGRTFHNVFKLPIPLLETSVANVTPISDHGRYLNAASLIIIDEISMCPLQALKAIDRLLRDLSINGDEKNKVFGGKTVLLCGDFRQMLPVIPPGSRSTLIENCIISWNVFPEFHHLTLTQNMRALPEYRALPEIEFVEFLKTIGNGEAAQYPGLGEDFIEIPKELVGEEAKIIDDIFGNIADDILLVRMLNSVILVPTNDSCSMINNEIIIEYLVNKKRGICWSAMVRDGRCTELLDERTTREECCASKGVATAWSPEDLDAGTLFFWRVLGGGVPCHPCKETCKDVQCGAGKKCVVRKGLPKCICFPHCRGHKSAYRGPVCGTDGRTYRSVCKLRKRACRKNNASLAVAYHGICQSSCDRIHCPTGKFCLLDQNLSPHCVRCSRRCSSHGPPARPVCGADHRTYPSACHLRQAACRRGKAIPIAYKGKCIPSASCEQIHCSLGQRCLRQLKTDQPRCVTCSSLPCPDHDGRHAIELCGSNNRTYSSWCHMVKDACATGYVIDTQAPGNCPSGDQRALLANTVLEGSLS